MVTETLRRECLFKQIINLQSLQMKSKIVNTDWHLTEIHLIEILKIHEFNCVTSI